MRSITVLKAIQDFNSASQLIVGEMLSVCVDPNVGRGLRTKFPKGRGYISNSWATII